MKLDEQSKMITVEMIPPSFDSVYDYIEEREIDFLLHVLEIGNVQFTSSIRTAAIRSVLSANRDKVLDFTFLFNPDWFKTLTVGQAAFVTAHEALHVYLDHPTRLTKFTDRHLADLAADYVINDILIHRTTLNEHPEEGCFGEKDFGFSTEDMSVEQVYELLQSRMPTSSSTLDEHDKFEVTVDPNADGSGSNGNVDSDDSINTDAIDDGESVIDVQTEIKELVGDEEKFEAKTSRGGGRSSFGVASENFQAQKVSIQLTKEFDKFLDRNRIVDTEVWTTPPRKLMSIWPKVILPSFQLRPNEKKDICIALDVSGSVQKDEINLFAALIQRIPYDQWNPLVITFNTVVTALTKEQVKTGKFDIGGGTTFQCIQEYLVKLRSYPSSIWCLTDGEGGSMDVPKQYQSRWIWVMVRNTAAKHLDYQGLTWGKRIPISQLYERMK
jgi:predicted metal-dependent peptidase